MARKGDGSTGTFTDSGNAASSFTRYTISAVIQSSAQPGTAGVTKPFSFADSGSNYDVSFCWDHTANPQTIFHRRSSGSYDHATITVPSQLSANTWYVVTVSYDGTNLNIYLNGSLQTQVASADPTAAFNPTFAVFAGSAGGSNFFGGQCAEVALWNVALQAGEIAALGKYVSPLLVRPTSLTHYWPLIRDPVPGFGGSFTTTGTTTVQTHPAVFYATNVHIYGPITTVAGAAKNASWSSHVTFAGPGFNIALSATMTSAVAFTSTFSLPPAFTQPVVFSSVFSSNAFGPESTRVNFRSVFSSAGPDLITSTFREFARR